MNTSTNRRDFLKQSTAVITGGISAGAVTESLFAAEDSSTPVPIVDTHHHLWDLKKFQLPWLKGEAVQSLNRSFVLSDYAKATHGLNVVKTVYMEVNVHPSQQVKEAEHVIALCKRKDNPMVAAVIGGYPFAKSFPKYIERFAKHKAVKGVRTVLHDPDRKKGLCLTPRFVESIKLLGEHGRSFDLCMRPGEIFDGAKLAEKCPKTRFIIDHCGNMPVTGSDKKLRARWMKGMKEAAAMKNIVCKISGIVVTAKKGSWKPADLEPNMSFCMETFGEDRCFFGGDWPVCTLKSTFGQWVNALKWITRKKSAKFRKKLFHDNAVRFYGLT